MDNENLNEENTAVQKSGKSHIRIIILIVIFLALAGILGYLIFNSFVTFNVTDKEYTDNVGNKGLYTGEWKGGRPCGNGKFTYTVEDGSTFEITGVFSAASVKGEMVYNYVKGFVNTYKGTFVNNNLEGEGSVISVPTEKADLTGDTQAGFISLTKEGSFSGGLLNGKGRQELRFNDHFFTIEGDYVNDLLNGYCVTHYEENNGYMEDYEGYVEDAKYKGQGKYITTYENGDIETIAGEFDDDNPVDGTRTTKYIASSGETKYGTVLNGEPKY